MSALLFLEQFQANNAWFELCTLAAFASIFIYGIFYAIAHGFNLDNLKRSSKAEILQALATFFMIVFVVGALSEIEDFSVSTFLGTDSYVVCGGEDIELYQMVGGEKKGDINQAIEVVSCRFEERAQELAEVHAEVLEGSWWFTFLTWNVGVAGVIIFKGDLIDHAYKETERYRLLNSFLTVVLIGTNSLIALVNYIKLNMLTVFLPFGLFLRSFKYTRGVGALFISLAIGLYFIFPVLFVMTDPGFVEVPEIPEEPPIDSATNFCLPTFSGTASQAQSLSGGATAGAKSEALGFAKTAISKFYIQMTTHAFVVFSITLVFIRYMMFILGGQAYDIMRFVSKVI